MPHPQRGSAASGRRHRLGPLQQGVEGKVVEGWMKRVRFGRWRGREGSLQGFTTYMFLFLSVVDIVDNIDEYFVSS